MTYDISGSWSATTGPLAPLKTCKADASAHSAVDNWTAAGFPASKMFVGIPSYATSWTTGSSKLAYADGSKLYQNFTSIPKGNSEDSNNATDSCGVTSTSYSGAWQYYQLIEEGVSRPVPHSLALFVSRCSVTETWGSSTDSSFGRQERSQRLQTLLRRGK